MRCTERKLGVYKIDDKLFACNINIVNIIVVAVVAAAVADMFDILRSRFCAVCCSSASLMRRTHDSVAASLSTTKKADLAV